MHIEVPTSAAGPTAAGSHWPSAPGLTPHGWSRRPAALVARCDILAISLHETMEEAKGHLRRLDAVGCGKTCEGDHSIATLSGDAPEVHGRLQHLGVPSAAEWLRTS